MKNYLLSILFIIPCFSLCSQSGELRSYCNEKYDFCIYFPDEIFDKETTLNNGEGVIFSSSDNDITLEILGVPNINHWTTKDIYYFTFEDILTTPPSNKLLSANIKPEFCIVESIIEKQRRYFEVRMRDEYYITIQLNVPKYLSELDYQHLISKIGFANAAIEEW